MLLDMNYIPLDIKERKKTQLVELRHFKERNIQMLNYGFIPFAPELNNDVFYKTVSQLFNT